MSETTQATTRTRSMPAPQGKLLPTNMRELHRSLVLQHLYQQEPKSRADLARATGLTRVTASDVVSDLLKANLVTELGLRETARIGKPATLIGFNGTARVIICLDLSNEHEFHARALDLDGNTVAEETERVSADKGADNSDTALTHAINLTRRLVDKQTQPVLGLGISTPGIVDNNGVVRTSTRLGWNGIALAQRFTDELALPTYVANDADTAALAECTYGNGSDAGILMVHLANGVGASIIIDGNLVKGINGTAGELGHVRITSTGPTCSCGRTGCVEAQVSAPRLRERTNGLTEQQRDSELAAAGTQLGTVLAPVAQTLGIFDVVLNGPATLLEGAFLDAVNEALADLTSDLLEGAVRARVSPLGDTSAALGASALVLRAQLGLS